VTQLHSSLQDGRYAATVGLDASVYLKAVLKYLSVAILNGAYKISKENQQERIIPQHLHQAIKNDEELSRFVFDVIISNGVGSDAMYYNAAIMDYLQQLQESQSSADK